MIISCFVFLTLISCAGQVKDNNEPTPDQRRISPNDRVIAPEVLDYFKSQELVCDSAFGCPSYLSKVIFYPSQKEENPRSFDDINVEKNAQDACMGILVDAFRVAFPLSCVKDHMRLTVGGECHNTMAFLFTKETSQNPNRPHQDRLLFCKEVEKIGQLNLEEDPALNHHPYVVVKISSSTQGRQTLSDLTLLVEEDQNLDIDDEQDNTQLENILQFNAFHLVEGVNEHLIRHTTCKMIGLNYIFPQMTFSYKSFKGCEFFSKGSYLTDDRYSQHFFAYDNLSENYKSRLKSQFRLPKIENLYFAYDLACILGQRVCADGIDARQLDRLRIDFTLPTNGQIDRLKDSLRDSFQEMTRKVRFDYQIMENNGLYYAQIKAPICFHSMQDWINEHRERGRRYRNYAIEQDRGEVRTLHIGVSESLEIHREWSFEKSNWDLRFSPRSLVNNRSSLVRIRANRGGELDDRSESFSNIGICADLALR